MCGSFGYCVMNSSYFLIGFHSALHAEEVAKAVLLCILIIVSWWISFVQLSFLLRKVIKLVSLVV